ncbi:MAG TPA: aminoglycoside phosphotransferase family protein [Candidatus Saccharimonadales bacterium]|nr:aminoglycoside phosphotransferase family protein [Candidatus Saccharimonadales bacterium]
MHSQNSDAQTIEHEKEIVKQLSNLPQASITFDDSGWDSRVYLVNGGEFVVKFPRSSKIQGRFASQITALRLASKTKADVAIPKVIWTHPQNEYFGYEGIAGIQLAIILGELDDTTKQFIGQELGAFLKDFHKQRLAGARDMSVAEEIKQLHNWYQKGIEEGKQFFTPAEQQKLHSAVYDVWPQLLTKLGNDLGLCHGDFHFKNIFYDENDQIGIIDFGDVCYADRSKDFINLDDPAIFESALASYGDTSDRFRQKIAIRKQMLQVIKLTAQLAKRELADAQVTAGLIKHSL